MMPLFGRARSRSLAWFPYFFLLIESPVHVPQLPHPSAADTTGNFLILFSMYKIKTPKLHASSPSKSLSHHAMRGGRRLRSPTPTAPRPAAVDTREQHVFFFLLPPGLLLLLPSRRSRHPRRRHGPLRLLLLRWLRGQGGDDAAAAAAAPKDHHLVLDSEEIYARTSNKLTKSIHPHWITRFRRPSHTQRHTRAPPRPRPPCAGAGRPWN